MLKKLSTCLLLGIGIQACTTIGNSEIVKNQDYDFTKNENFEKGLDAMVNNDWKSAFQHFHKCAEDGVAACEYEVSTYYSFGRMGVVKEDKKKEIYWLEKATSNGYPKAKARLGLYYAYGEYGLKEDKNKAKKYLQEAMDAGDDDAAYYYSKIFGK